MKKYILSIIALVLSMLSGNAQTVSIDDLTIKSGETKVVSINLTNTQSDIVSFQMDLTLPEGITINKAGCALGSRITDDDQELTIGKQPDGSIRLTSTSLALNPITGTSGEIIKLSLTAANDAKGGITRLKNIILATSNSQKLKTADVTFKVNVPYTLTYKIDGSEYKKIEVVCGATITPETAPSKEGHMFSGWSEIPATMPAKDVVVTGTFSINSYTLTYKVDGEVYKTFTVVYGTTLTLETEPTKEGYTFSGWSELPATMPAKDVEVTGNFTINKYKLTYMVDGEEYKSYEINFATTITPEAFPVKEGYTFSGWSEVPKTMPAKDVVVTGTFSINSYTLTYKVDGEVYKTSTVVYGSALTLEAEPAKAGYTFSGWSELPATMPAHDVTVTGQYIIHTHTLTYKVNGAVYKTYTLNYHQTITPEAAPVSEGYTFSGWSEIPELMPDNDVEVTGTLTINSYTITYKVDGEVYKTASVVYGTALTPEEEPTKEGYTFSGWSEIPATMPAKDVEITGTFTINSYKLTYLVNEEEYKTYFVNYGSALTLEAEPTKAGYTFSGWSELPETMPANDVTVTGNFIVKPATGIAIDKDSLTFNTFDSQRLSVTLAPADLVNKAVTWSSTNTEIVTVDKDGVVTPVDNGVAFIVACTTDGTELNDSCKVTVDFKAATLSIDKKEITITELKSLQLIATVTPDKANQNVIWSSSDESIVSVDETGTIKPLRNGVAEITATTADGTQLKATSQVTVNIPSLFEATVTQTTLAVRSKSGVPEAKNMKVKIGDNAYDLSEEDAKVTGLAPNSTYHMNVKAELGEYSWTEELDVTTADIAVNFDGKATPTTLDVSVVYDEGDATVTRAGFDRGTENTSISLKGLEPNQRYEFTYYITTEEGGTASYKAQFSTDELTLKVTQTKVVAIGEVVVVASSNIVEEEDVSVGFEWRRFDWPDEIETRSGAAYIYEGTIEGSVKNLNAEKFWKIRPFFQSKMGHRFYADWVTVDPSDASFFEPSVHTYNTISVEGNTAELKGFVMEGSDNVTSQGFMYWKNVPSSTRRNAKGIPSNAMMVEAKGNTMVVSLENLDYDTEYCYVAFVTTSGNETFYGEEQSFKTGEPSQDVIDGIANEELRVKNEEFAGAVYDLNGRRLPAPQKGINIIRMSDGTVKKVLVK